MYGRTKDALRYQSGSGLTAAVALSVIAVAAKIADDEHSAALATSTGIRAHDECRVSVVWMLNVQVMEEYSTGMVALQVEVIATSLQ